MSDDYLPNYTDAFRFDILVRALCALHRCSVTSTVRTTKRNAAVGGHPNSWHLISRGGLGADLVPDTKTAAKMQAVARDARKLGLHPYVEDDHVHLQPLPPIGSRIG